MIEFEAEVVDVRQESRGRWQLLLDRSGFSAESATGWLAAVAPSGVGIEVPVIGVVSEGEGMWLRVDKPLGVGTAVSAHVE